MVQLIGNLTGIGLARLLQFLAELHVSGRLCVAFGPDNSTGSLFLEDGRVVGAVLDGGVDGLLALEAIAFTSTGASFGLSDAAGDFPHNLNTDPSALQAHVYHLGQDGARLLPVIGSLRAVAELTLPEDGPDDDAAIVLKRGALRFLIDLRNHTTVLELAHRYGLGATLANLDELLHLGLVRFTSNGVDSSPDIAAQLTTLHTGRNNNHELHTTSASPRTDQPRTAGG